MFLRYWKYESIQYARAECDRLMFLLSARKSPCLRSNPSFDPLCSQNTRKIGKIKHYFYQPLHWRAPSPMYSIQITMYMISIPWAFKNAGFGLFPYRTLTLSHGLRTTRKVPLTLNIRHLDIHTYCHFTKDNDSLPYPEYYQITACSLTWNKSNCQNVSKSQFVTFWTWFSKFLNRFLF